MMAPREQACLPSLFAKPGESAPVKPAAPDTDGCSGRLGAQGLWLGCAWCCQSWQRFDLLVDFPASRSFEQYMDLKLALEDLLRVPVDLVTRRGLRPELRQRLEQEAIALA